jgi:hypothetical protein
MPFGIELDASRKCECRNNLACFSSELYLAYMIQSRFLKSVALLIALFFASGCASQVDNSMKSWIGAHQSKLIRSWGPPQRTASDGNGGVILIYGNYVNLGQVPGQVTTDYFGNVSYTAPQPQGYQRTRMFYVDRNGYVYDYDWQGL